MATRANLHRQIDALPDDMLPLAARWLSELDADANAAYVPLHKAPLAEPEEDELAAVSGRRPTLADGEWISREDLKRDLGL